MLSNAARVADFFIQDLFAPSAKITVNETLNLVSRASAVDIFLLKLWILTIFWQCLGSSLKLTKGRDDHFLGQFANYYRVSNNRTAPIKCIPFHMICKKGQFDVVELIKSIEGFYYQL